MNIKRYTLVLLLLAAIISSCGESTPKLVVVTSNGNRLTGPLSENLQVSTSLQSQSLFFSTEEIRDIELHDIYGDVTIESVDGSTIRGILIGNSIHLLVEGQTVSIPISTIKELSMDW